MKNVWLLNSSILPEILKRLYDTYQRWFQSTQHHHCRGPNKTTFKCFSVFMILSWLFSSSTWAENISKHDSTSYPEYSANLALKCKGNPGEYIQLPISQQSKASWAVKMLSKCAWLQSRWKIYFRAKFTFAWLTNVLFSHYSSERPYQFSKHSLYRAQF